MFWRKKQEAVPPPTGGPERVELRADDPPLVRADKIWRLLGFANDRAGMVPQMAAYLSAYQDLDAAKARASGQ